MNNRMNVSKGIKMHLCSTISQHSTSYTLAIEVGMMFEIQLTTKMSAKILHESMIY